MNASSAAAAAAASTNGDGSAAPIKLIASDVDGTFLDTRNAAPARNIRAALAALERGVHFVLATGKSRAGALAALGELSTAWRRYAGGVHGSAPGVFLQGLVVYGFRGEVVYERTLDRRVARDLVALHRELGAGALVAYSGDRIVCEARNAHTDSLIPYHEPVPEALGSWASILAAPDATLHIHKMIVIDSAQRIERLRPRVEALVGHWQDGHGDHGERRRGTCVQAVPTMLEVLPPGASKGDGLRRLLRHVGVDPAHVLAIGDAENDVEMLRMAGTGVAVANALEVAKAAADYVLEASSSEAGVAEAIERFALRARACDEEVYRGGSAALPTDARS